MKTNPSSYVLAIEILIITLFHVVKIKQAEKHPAELAFSHVSKNLLLNKPAVVETKASAEYLLVSLVK
jgi:hypothetical protein